MALTGKKEEGSRDQERSERESSFRHSSEDLRSLSTKSETVQNPRSTVKHRAEETKEPC